MGILSKVTEVILSCCDRRYILPGKVLLKISLQPLELRVVVELGSPVAVEKVATSLGVVVRVAELG